MSTAVDEQIRIWKDDERGRWAAGEYDRIAKRDLWAIGEQLVQRIGILPGERVLDVACGTGNAAIRAAQAGGSVVGVDLTPEMFDAGRKEAAKSGVEVEWVEGDAEAMPFEDESFDVVLSVFGSIYPPRHRVVAQELVRVLRPGGRLGFTAWASGGMSSFIEIIEPFVPPSPDFVDALPLWGSQDHIREVFAGTGINLEFETDTLRDDGLEPLADPVEFYTTHLGPLIMLRKWTESQGRWDELRVALTPWYTEAEAEYIVVVGRKAAWS